MAPVPATQTNQSDAGIGVAIPCYQHGHLLRECVESVLTQGLPRLRVLIIDNASTDDSLEVAQQLAHENPCIEVVAHQRNLGPHASFNEAVEWATEKYFLLLCADDMSAPGALARSITALEQHPQSVLSYGPAALIGTEGPFAIQPSPAGAASAADEAEWRIFPGDELLKRFCGSGICHIAGCTAVVRTEVQKQVGYYRPTLPHTDDFEMWMRFSRYGSIAETSATQGVIRVHDACQSAYVRERHRWDILNCEDAFESFFANEGAQLSDTARLHRFARASLGARAYWSAAAHLARGDLCEALAIFRIAVRLRQAWSVLPPISYLLRRQDSLARAKDVLTRAVQGARWSMREVRSEA